jgi:hypothetical protein
MNLTLSSIRFYTTSWDLTSNPHELALNGF